jgi:hypothetical protein
MDPLNYVLNVQDPFAAVMNGFNNGQNRLALQQDMRQSEQQNAMGLRQGEQGLMAGQQAMDLNASQEQRAQTEFSQGQTDRAAAMAAEQQQAAASQQRAAAMQADLAGLAERVQAGTATQQDFAALTLKYPDLADELSSSMDAYEPERKRAEVFDVSRVAAALKAGSTELAIQIAQERADAAQNAGLARDAAMWQGAADTIKASPEAGLTIAGLMLWNLDADAAKQVFPEGRAVQSTQPYDNGTTVTVFTDGSKEVTDAAGQVLSGPKATEAITSALASEAEARRANAAGATSGRLGAEIDLAGEAAGAKAAGEQSIAKSGEAFDNLNKVTSNITNIDTALAALDRGASAGMIDKYLVSTSEASASLDNAMNRLGLDVIGSVTFGALSEAEMKLAMETAVPRNLNEAQLRQWLQDKRAAQVKASDALYKAAVFLGTPGNTLAKWLEGKKASAPTENGDGKPTDAPAQNTFTFNPETGDFE